MPARAVPPRFLLAAPLVVFLLLTAASVLCGSFACRERTGRPRGKAASDPKGFIAVVGASKSDELWPVLRASALRCSHEFGGTPVRTFAPDHASQSEQAKLIQSLRGPDLRGLCVQVVDPQAIARLLDEIRASGVLVVTLMRPVPSSLRLHHCGPYEPEVGQAIALALAEALGRGNIAVLRSTRTNTDLKDRHRGFANELDQHPGITVLRQLTFDGSTRQARKFIREFTERFPRLHGFAVLDELAFTELGDSPTPPTCKLVSVAPYPSTWAHLARQRCHALVGTRYDRIAYQAVQWCLLAADGVELKAQTHDTGVHTVWAGNLDAWKRQWHEWTQMPPP